MDKAMVLPICMALVSIAVSAHGSAGSAAAPLSSGARREPGRTIVRPADTGEALINPSMGWTMHFYSNNPATYGSQLEPSDSVQDFPGLSTIYMRIPWAFIEPEEGKFNWALFDTPAQRWIARGGRVGLCISCSESWLRFATPEWVKKAGAKGYFYDIGKGRSEKGALWDPDFGDRVFLGKLEHLLAAMSARYDGNPNVAFVDIGSYGLWGEGHTHYSSRVPKNKAPGIIRTHINLFLKYFPHTLLCGNDDWVGPHLPGLHFPLTDYALSKGVTLRDDSILVNAPPYSYYHDGMAQAFWPRFPVVLEHQHYGPSKASNAWGDGSLLLKAVEDYHASYMSVHWWPRVELAENRDVITAVNRRMGYRIQLREMSWPNEVRIGKPFNLKSVWANAGVAPCYPGGFMAITLKDNKGGFVAVMTDEGFDVRDLKPGPKDAAPLAEHVSELTAGLVAPVTKPGTYDLYVSIGQRDGTPRIALPLGADDGQRRYELGTITLTDAK